MKSYNGAVLFLDMLGVSALTLGKFEIKKDDYAPWGIEEEFLGNKSLSYVIYKDFQTLIVDTAKKYNVQIYLLSDNAFVWSVNSISVIKFSAEFMQKALNIGLLCRGGLSYGEIIEEINGVNQILLGDAVTNAVKLEGKSKGSRILIDFNIPMNVYDVDNDFANKFNNHIFAPLENPINYEIYDEYKWYVFPYNMLNSKISSIVLMDGDKIEATKERMKLLNRLVLSPKFRWNCITQEGLVHIKASIRFVGQNDILQVHVHRILNEHVNKRDQSLLSDWDIQMSDQTNYQIVG